MSQNDYATAIDMILVAPKQTWRRQKSKQWFNLTAGNINTILSSPGLNQIILWIIIQYVQETLKRGNIWKSKTCTVINFIPKHSAAVTSFRLGLMSQMRLFLWASISVTTGSLFHLLMKIFNHWHCFVFLLVFLFYLTSRPDSAGGHLAQQTSWNLKSSRQKGRTRPSPLPAKANVWALTFPNVSVSKLTWYFPSRVD